jgi:hypothetical protein
VLIVDSVGVSSSQCYKYFNFSSSTHSLDLLAVHLFRSATSNLLARSKQCPSVLCCDFVFFCGRVEEFYIFLSLAHTKEPKKSRRFPLKTLFSLRQSFDSHDNHFLKRSSNENSPLIHKNLHFFQWTLRKTIA